MIKSFGLASVGQHFVESMGGAWPGRPAPSPVRPHDPWAEIHRKAQALEPQVLSAVSRDPGALD